MGSKWQTVKLKDIVNFNTGKLNSNAAVDDGQYPFFTCSPETLRINTHAFDCEAVLLAGNNANGVFPVKYYDGKFNAYQRTYVITPKANIELDVKWLFFQIQHVTKVLQKLSVGTATKFLTKQILDSFEVKLPPVEHQKRISNHLWSLLEKENLNRQINQTLEQMAQALFKSWFVDFDPVIDNSLDAGFFEQNLAFPDELLRRAETRRAVREHGDCKPLPDAIYQLFPAAFEECAEPSLGLGGWVPKGWKHGCVADVARYSTKRIDTEELTLENYISTENMLADRKGIQPAATLPTVNSVPAYATGSILISNIRPYFKKIWLANGCGGHSNDVLGFEAKDSDTECYVFNLMYQDSFFDFMMATSKGSKMPRGDKKAILEWGLIVPPLNLRLFFSEKVRKFYTSSYGRHHENITLAQLRDTLLPKLISGELRLDNIEADLTKIEVV
ncbi:restriction endonuclease subunit S [Aeromonas veronii]|uniref:restriction endonuclease subunit S n=1 Tax=Aeromonas veronii TaxID=654 RepID=UPI003D25A8F1